jgi:hypothetical protein
VCARSRGLRHQRTRLGRQGRDPHHGQQPVPERAPIGTAQRGLRPAHQGTERTGQQRLVEVDHATRGEPGGVFSGDYPADRVPDHHGRLEAGRAHGPLHQARNPRHAVVRLRQRLTVARQIKGEHPAVWLDRVELAQQGSPLPPVEGEPVQQHERRALPRRTGQRARQFVEYRHVPSP